MESGPLATGLANGDFDLRPLVEMSVQERLIRYRPLCDNPPISVERLKPTRPRRWAAIAMNGPLGEILRIRRSPAYRPVSADSGPGHPHITVSVRDKNLIEAANGAGMHKLTSRVFPENIASRALLKRVGFEEIGIHRRHGKLDGLWRDCVIVERLLDEDHK
jgi:hypothetical protein